MSTNHHTALPYGGRLTATDMELPLSQLDSAIASVIATGSGASTTLTAQALSGQKNMVVADRANWAVGDVFWIGLAGGTYESGVIASGTGAGAGTLVAVANLASTYASGTPVSKSPVEIVNARGTYTNLGGRITAIENRVYDVKRYGATGDGTTDDTTSIEAASLALSAAGGGDLYFPPGTYIVHFFAIPSWPTDYAAVICRAGCTIVGAGIGASTIKLKANEPSYASAGIVRNADMDGGDEVVGIADITVDGNGANETTLYQGVDWRRVRGARNNRVRVKNVRGTASFPPGETFHFNAFGSAEIFYADCEVIGTAGTHGSGFATNYCVNVTRVNCVGHGMTAGMGFADYRSRGILNVNCISQRNGAHGFNAEFCEDLVWVACRAGGRAAEGAGNYPWGADQVLGNTSSGFTVNGTTRVQLIGCLSERNGDNGLSVVVSGGITPDVSIDGGVFANNTNYGINFNAVASAQAARISRQTRFTGNTGDLYLNGGPGATSFESVNAAPAVPATTIVYTSEYPMDMTVHVSGGTVTVIKINGTTTGLTSGSFRVRAGSTIAITYSVAPTWVWLPW
jgi:hypothetical protein